MAAGFDPPVRSAESAREQLRALVAHLDAHADLVVCTVDPVSVVTPAGWCRVYAPHGLASVRAWVASLPGATVTLRMETCACVEIAAAPFHVMVLFDAEQTWTLAAGLRMRGGDARGVTVAALADALGVEVAPPDALELEPELDEAVGA